MSTEIKKSSETKVRIVIPCPNRTGLTDQTLGSLSSLGEVVEDKESLMYIKNDIKNILYEVMIPKGTCLSLARNFCFYGDIKIEEATVHYPYHVGVSVDPDISFTNEQMLEIVDLAMNQEAVHHFPYINRWNSKLLTSGYFKGGVLGYCHQETTANIESQKSQKMDWVAAGFTAFSIQTLEKIRQLPFEEGCCYYVEDGIYKKRQYTDDVGFSINCLKARVPLITHFDNRVEHILED